MDDIKHIGKGFNPFAELVRNRNNHEAKQLLRDSEWVVNMVLERLSEIYTNAYDRPKNQRSLDVRKSEWLQALFNAGITTSEQIDTGIAIAHTQEDTSRWPSIGQFCKWCNDPRARDLPTVDDAYQHSIVLNRLPADYQEIKRLEINDKSERVIRHAIKQIDPLRYREMPAHEARKQFEYYYHIAVEQFIRGKLKEIPKALEGTKEKSKQEIEIDKMVQDFSHAKGYNNAMAEMRRKLGMSKRD